MAQFDAASFILALSSLKHSRGSYADLPDKPTINGVEVVGNKTSTEYGISYIVSAENNTAINGYQVPQLTSEQIISIYNAVVAGKNVTIVDATSTMYFQGVNVDIVSDEIFVSFRYFMTMLLEYSENGAITFISLE